MQPVGQERFCQTPACTLKSINSWFMSSVIQKKLLFNILCITWNNSLGRWWWSCCPRRLHPAACQRAQRLLPEIRHLMIHLQWQIFNYSWLIVLEETFPHAGNDIIQRRTRRFLPNTLVINRCTLELTPPVLYSPSMVMPSCTHRYVLSDKSTLLIQNLQSFHCLTIIHILRSRDTSCFQQLNAPLHKVEACLIEKCCKNKQTVNFWCKGGNINTVDVNEWNFQNKSDAYSPLFCWVKRAACRSEERKIVNIFPALRLLCLT